MRHRRLLQLRFEQKTSRTAPDPVVVIQTHKIKCIRSNRLVAGSYGHAQQVLAGNSRNDDGLSKSLKLIFDRFYKTDLSRGKDKKGTGLGLSITKEIIQAHNENINVISTEGVGSEFIFSLPVADEDDE